MRWPGLPGEAKARPTPSFSLGTRTSEVPALGLPAGQPLPTPIPGHEPPGAAGRPGVSFTPDPEVQGTLTLRACWLATVGPRAPCQLASRKGVGLVARGSGLVWLVGPEGLVCSSDSEKCPLLPCESDVYCVQAQPRAGAAHCQARPFQATG